MQYWLVHTGYQGNQYTYKANMEAYIYIHTYFISNTAVTRTTLCWEDSKATTALTAALKKKKKQLKRINTKINQTNNRTVLSDSEKLCTQRI